MVIKRLATEEFSCRPLRRSRNRHSGAKAGVSYLEQIAVLPMDRGCK